MNQDVTLHANDQNALFLERVVTMTRIGVHPAEQENDQRARIDIAIHV